MKWTAFENYLVITPHLSPDPNMFSGCYWLWRHCAAMQQNNRFLEMIMTICYQHPLTSHYGGNFHGITQIMLQHEAIIKAETDYLIKLTATHTESQVHDKIQKTGCDVARWVSLYYTNRGQGSKYNISNVVVCGHCLLPLPQLDSFNTRWHFTQHRMVGSK